MKKWHIFIFLLFASVFLYRIGQVAWDRIALRTKDSQETHVALPCGYWLYIYPKNGTMYDIFGATLWISGPGCYLALVGPNCFRDRAFIGCGAVLLSGAALLVGWRRKSWKVALVGTCLAVAYGMYFKPWLALEKMQVGNQKLYSQYYWQIVPWLWCMRFVAVAWVISLIASALLAGVALGVFFRRRDAAHLWTLVLDILCYCGGPVLFIPSVMAIFNICLS